MLKKLLFGESRDEYVEKMCERHTAQELSDMLMESVNGKVGKYPGYSKEELAKILYHVKGW